MMIHDHITGLVLSGTYVVIVGSETLITSDGSLSLDFTSQTITFPSQLDDNYWDEKLIRG
jgi:hypothetical protein